MIIIPDISHYNPVKDWNELKGSGVKFLISKATQGTKYVDPTLDEFIKGCEKHKIPYWLYCYLNKDNEVDQVKHMINTCKGKIGPFFVGYILDIESGNTPENCQMALDYLLKQGYKMMIYTGNADYPKYKNLILNRGTNCAHWEARYGPNDGKYHESFPCSPSADLHQYTSRGSFAGLREKTDLSRLTGRKPLEWFVSRVNNSGKSRAGKVTTDLFIRKGPGTEFSAIGCLPEGSNVQILDTVINSNGKPWHKINHGERIGYISGKYVKEGA